MQVLTVVFFFTLLSDFKSTMKGLFEEAKLNWIQIFSILIYFCFYVHTSALEIYDLHKITFDLTNEDKILFSPGIKKHYCLELHMIYPTSCVKTMAV